MSGGPPIEVDVKERNGQKYIVITFPTWPGKVNKVAFTPTEARTLASFLTTKADEIEGGA